MRIHKRRARPVLIALLPLLPAVGCRSVPPGTGIPVTPAMREACPQLSDEVLEAFLVAIDGLRERGLSEPDAEVEWIEGCQDIRPDGNFQGDVEACEACLIVLVDQVYAAA